MPIRDSIRAGVGWLRKRVEIFVPVLALPVFFSMAGSGDRRMPTAVTVLVWILAVVYVGLVIWSPMGLPLKELRAMAWRRIGWAARIVGWGLLVSAILFGLYHISPLSGQGAGNLATAPIIAVLSSFGMGLANGIIYRYRGFTTAVLAHGVGNWLVLMIMTSAM